MVFVTNRLDHVYFSEPLENRNSVFKKYGMCHLVNTNNFFIQYARILNSDIRFMTQ